MFHFSSYRSDFRRWSTNLTRARVQSYVASTSKIFGFQVCEKASSRESLENYLHPSIPRNLTFRTGIIYFTLTRVLQDNNAFKTPIDSETKIASNVVQVKCVNFYIVTVDNTKQASLQ